VDAVDADRRGGVVADAGGFVELLDAVVVVPCAFDRAWAVAFAAGRDLQPGDLAEVLG
jgi:hypothetical protein